MPRGGNIKNLIKKTLEGKRKIKHKEGWRSGMPREYHRTPHEHTERKKKINFFFKKKGVAQ